jgi:hypothetical protein
MTKKKQDMINDVGDEPTPVKAQAPTLPPAPIPGLTPGRMVHWIVLNRDAHRPAIITNVVDAVEGIVNLVVFWDGQNDGRSGNDCAQWVENAQYSEFHAVGTWHFIEKA